jgi:hypothetical protein
MLAPDNRFTPVMDIRGLKSLPNVYEAKDMGQCTVTNYGGSDTVTLNWQLNDEACRNHLFEVSIGGTKAIISYDEWLYIGRVMFAHREYNTNR